MIFHHDNNNNNNNNNDQQWNSSVRDADYKSTV